MSWVSLSTLSRIATWHIRDETYAKALAEIVNHQHQLEFAAHWGDGTTSSSDGSDSKPEVAERLLGPSMPDTAMSQAQLCDDRLSAVRFGRCRAP